MKVKLLPIDKDEVINKIYTACRTCYSQGTPEDIYKEIKDKEHEVGKDELTMSLEREKKIKLIKQVLESGHGSTYEHQTVTFLISDLSRAAAQQLTRHRIGCSYSMQSQRYVTFKDGKFEHVVPAKIKNNPEALDTFNKAMDAASTYYNALVSLGMPAEDARSVLPNACSTNITFTVNLRELIHICNERLCTCAQDEIRTMVGKMVKEVVKELPFLKEYLVPKCERLGYCNELKRSCGRKEKKWEQIKKV